jgi:hypothetical protein
MISYSTITEPSLNADDGFAAGEPEVAKKKTPEPTEETDQAAAERVNEQAADKEGLDEV